MLQDSATPKMVRNVIDGTTPPQKVVGSYEQLEDGTYNLIIGLAGDAPSAAAITQINGKDLAGKEFYDYVRTEGAVLFSFNPDFSPAARYGGSWERITDRFLIGAGGSYAPGSTGGEANVTLTEEQTPPHRHDVIDGDTGVLIGLNTGVGVDGITISPSSWNNTNNVGKPLFTTFTGGGQAHNNLPPYLAANIWRRVA